MGKRCQLRGLLVADMKGHGVRTAPPPSTAAENTSMVVTIAGLANRRSWSMLHPPWSTCGSARNPESRHRPGISRDGTLYVDISPEGVPVLRGYFSSAVSECRAAGRPTPTPTGASENAATAVAGSTPQQGNASAPARAAPLSSTRAEADGDLPTSVASPRGAGLSAEDAFVVKYCLSEPECEMVWFMGWSYWPGKARSPRTSLCPRGRAGDPPSLARPTHGRSPLTAGIRLPHAGN